MAKTSIKRSTRLKAENRIQQQKLLRDIKAGRIKDPSLVKPKVKKVKKKSKQKRKNGNKGNLPEGVFGFGEKLRERIRKFELK